MEFFTDQSFEMIKEPLEKAEYEECIFRNCDLSESDLSEFKFIDCEFEECNFSNVKLQKTAFQDCIFKNCKLLGLHFELCNSIGFSMNFDNCQLDHSSFYQVNLTQSSFSSCTLKGVDFTEAILTGSSITFCDLQDAQFEQTNLEKADLRNSNNYAINPETNKIRGAHFSLNEIAGLLSQYNLKIEP